MRRTHRTLRRLGQLAVPLVLAAVTLALVQVAPAAADFNPITDLPFYGTYELTCGWHFACSRSHGYDPTAGAIDIGTPSGTSVYAAGDGTVTTAGGDVGGPLGYHIRINHSGEESVYAHLDWYFASTADMEVCRHVALGYSGSTGNVSGPHIHFGGEDHPDQMTPIYGRRSSAQKYTVGDFQWDPYSNENEGKDGPPISHDGVDTNAYTVDDVQRREFKLAQGLAWQPAGGVGFGYNSLATATMYYHPIPSGNERTTQPVAQWTPNLPTKDKWAVYAFIPSQHATATKAMYTTGGSRRQATLNQAAYYNDWVELFGPSDPIDAGPGQTVTISLSDGRNCTDCAQQELGADAMLFVPGNC